MLFLPLRINCRIDLAALQEVLQIALDTLELHGRADQLPDSRFCDACGLPLAGPASTLAPVHAPVLSHEAQPVEVFSTSDFGEQAFIKSFLEDRQIRVLDPYAQADSMSLWTSPFARQFRVFVMAGQAEEARDVLKGHFLDPSTIHTSRGGQPLIRLVMVLQIVAVLVSFGLTLYLYLK